jgi:hypothetical protein
VGGTGGAGGAPASPAVLAFADGPTFDFGTQGTGLPATRGLTVNNTGATAATGIMPSALTAPFSFAGGAFPGTGGTCDMTLAPGASCTVVVSFQPTSVGAASMTLTLDYDDGHAPATVLLGLAGLGSDHAVLSLSGAPMFDFGTLARGTTASHVLTLTNSGPTGATGLTPASLLAPFSYTGGAFPGAAGTCASALAALASCDIDVTYAPTVVGTGSATITIAYNDGFGPASATRPLAGRSTELGVLSLSDGPSFDYGVLPVGGAGAHTFTLANTGLGSALAIAPSGLGGPFVFAGGTYPGTAGTCGATLAAGASCTLVVTFAPSATGGAARALTIAYNDGVAARSVAEALTGTGVAPALLAFAPPTFDFGTHATGSATDHTFTVTNTGGFAASAMSAGAPGAAFPFKGGAYPGTGGTCPAALAVGLSCTVVVTFTPTSAGAVSGTLALSYFDGAGNRSAGVSLTGTGAAPALLAFTEAPSVDFGTRAAGSSTDHTLTLSNGGGVAATSLAGGALGGGFSFKGGVFPGAGGSCSTTLAAATTCTIVVTFSPVAAGNASAMVSVGYGDGAATQSASIALAGMGAAPAVLVYADAPGYDFGTVAVGATGERALSITNTGGVAATALAGGALGGGFAYKGGAFPGTGGSCAGPLAAAASCTVLVTFAPGAPGSQSRTLSIGYNDGAAAQSAGLGLTGKGAAPAVVAFSPATYDYGTHANGAPTDKTFTVTNSGGVGATGLAPSGLGGAFVFKGGAYPGTGGSCMAALAASTSCTVIVTFTPAATGPASATLTLAYTDGVAGQSAGLGLVGAGTPPALLSLSDGPSYDFGALATGSSTNHIFYLSNTGGVAATSLSGAAPGAPFAYTGGAYPGTGGSCGTALAAGAICALNVTFAPSSPTTSMTSLSVGYNDGVTSRTASRAMTGTGTTLAALAITDFPPDYYHLYGLTPDPATFDFGARGVGSTMGHTFYVANTGAASATVMAGGALPAPFAFPGGAYPGSGGTCTTTLAAGAICTVVVTFSPTAVVGSSATLSVSYNDGSVARNATRPLSGTGTTAPVLVIEDFQGVSFAGPWDFGTRGIGIPSEHQFFVTNTGGAQAVGITAPAVGVGYSYKGGTYPGAGGTCGTTLAAGSTCSVYVLYAPVASGVATGTVRLDYGDGAGGSYSATRAVRGVGTTQALLQIDDNNSGGGGPVSDYGVLGVGHTSDRTLTVSNFGGAMATTITFTAPAAPYQWSGGSFPGNGGTCGPTLAAGTSCTLVVTFAPVAAGTFPAAVRASYNDGAASQTAQRSLTGQAVDAAFLVINDWTGGSGGQVFDYGTWGIPTDHTFYVINEGSKTAVSMSGIAPGAPFSWKDGTFPGTGGTCGPTLAAGASCAVVVTYSGASTSGGSFGVSYGDGNGNTKSVTRAVNGVAATAAVLEVTDCNGCGTDNNPADFGTVGSSTQRTFWVTNTGAKVAGSLADGHTLGNGFSFAGGTFPGQGGTCTSTLAQGASCQVSVVFAPSGVGTFSSTLTVSYGDGTGTTASASRALTGAGTNLAILTVRDWSQTSTDGGQWFDYGTDGTPTDHTFYITNDGAQSATTIKDGHTLGGGGFNWKGGVYPGTGGSCGPTLSAGAYCTVVVTFSPSGNGARSSTLTVSYFDGSKGSTATRGLAGTATDAALVQISDWGGPQGMNPPPFDYGTWGNAQDHTFTLINSGAQAATSMGDAGMLGGNFGWKDGTYPGTGGSCTTTLSSANSCTVVVTFTPSGSGARSSELAVGYNDGHAGQTATRALMGTAVAQAFLRFYDWQGPNQPIPWSPFDYGTWGIATDHTFTISNDGGAQATGIADGGGMGAGFAWKGGTFPGTGGTCTTTTLNKGTTCDVVVTFTPGGGSLQSGTAQVSYYDGTAWQVATRAMMGTPTAHAFLTVSEYSGWSFCTNCSPFDFGTLPTGSVGEHTFTVFNTGAIGASGLASSGALGVPFAFKGGAFPGTGGSCNTTLTAGMSCTVVVTFSPTQAITSNSVIGVQFTDASTTPFSATRTVQGTGN